MQTLISNIFDDSFKIKKKVKKKQQNKQVESSSGCLRLFWCILGRHQYMKASVRRHPVL